MSRIRPIQMQPNDIVFHTKMGEVAPKITKKSWNLCLHEVVRADLNARAPYFHVFLENNSYESISTLR